MGHSPVVPTGQTHVVPASTWNSTCRCKASMSTWPSRNGVIMATVRPAKSSLRVGMVVNIQW